MLSELFHCCNSNSKTSEATPKDRLKIGSSAEGNEQERRYTESLVAQEKELEQAKARVAELEKNIADLQNLLDKSKDKKLWTGKFYNPCFSKIISNTIWEINIFGQTNITPSQQNNIANLRNEQYLIPKQDIYETRKIAGNIIPAMITTTSLISGLTDAT